MLDEEMREQVREIVRGALQAAVAGGHYEPPAFAEGELAAPCGCFVTLKTHGALRGCLGCFVSEDPLYLSVARLTADSALEDPRFAGRRLTERELPDVRFDVSVLSPLVPCDDPEGIQLGTHGIYVSKGIRSGCFLPQVALETGWDVETFWSMCCQHKAGLPAGAWRGTGVERFVFTAEIVEGDMVPAGRESAVDQEMT